MDPSPANPPPENPALAAIVVSWLTRRAVIVWGWGLGLLATGVLIPVLLYLYPVS
ncbi:hypothetical protein [Amycolatopsis samaneae]|uniref:ABC transporter permease n=1 Tax=Amycolatopsis samaneae TaxID=664691 RepID=A0ABW5GIZ8_9PSEU